MTGIEGHCHSTAVLEGSRLWKRLPLERVEWIVAVLLSATVLFLLIVRATHAGALWRDECDIAQLARMARFNDVLANLQYTAFPVLFPAIVRAYTSAFGASDIALRCFGLGVGVALVGAAWFQSRYLHGQVPLLLPALIGLNVNFLTLGTSLRGYGIGSVLVVLAFALTAGLLLQPSMSRLAAVLLAYLASMQCLFFNGALVPAFILAAAVVFLIRRERKWMWLLLGVAAVCGLSYLPSILKLSSSTKEWAAVLQVPVSFNSMWHQFMTACGGAYSTVSTIWLGLILLAVAGAAWRLKAVWRAEHSREGDMLLFGLVTILTCVPTYYIFLRVVHCVPQPRYYLAFVCLVAVAADLIVANLSRSHWIRLTRMFLVVAAIFTLPFAVWPKIMERQTNIDIVAAYVEKNAHAGDLVVVNPWSLGVSFNRYYHGAVRWITVPEMDEHRVHRYDLLQKKMASFFPVDDVEHEIAAALKRGSRVWFIGEVEMPPAGEAPLVLTPAPDPKFGWQLIAYRQAWSQELGVLMQQHAGSVDIVVPTGLSVSEWENVRLLAVEGWQY
jgi:hypothetical protein